MKKINKVYVFTNGMCMVFDKDGEQIPEYQGRWEEVSDSILKDKPAEVTIQGGCWLGLSREKQPKEED